MNLKSSKTAQNLVNSFAGESQARNRYTYYAGVAAKEGHKHIEAIFLETGDNERAHAKVFYDYIIEGLGNEGLRVEADYPFGIGTTVDNLLFAAEGEKEENTILYPEFEKVAREEGFERIAKSFHEISEVEEHHQGRYEMLRERMLNNELYEMPVEVIWKCRNCGYIHVGKSAPKVCPSCKHPQGYFEMVYDHWEIVKDTLKTEE